MGARENSALRTVRAKRDADEAGKLFYTTALYMVIIFHETGSIVRVYIGSKL